ncbi:MAG: flotillin family protein [Firmicutes bacterium]|nr:flotillin family protein [Bacillota bacterium]
MPLEVLSVPVIIIVVLILLILGFVSMWKKVPQDKALVVTGLKKRVISGGGGMVIPLLERTDAISLENMKMEVGTEGALTEQGVDISADGIAVIKVRSDIQSILSAIEQFNTGNEKQTIDVIKETARDILEGKLREILSTMTVEEIYKNRERFASQVQEVAAVELADMGLEIKAFTIRDIKDDNGYLEALGKKRISEVKRDAAIAEAIALRDETKETSIAQREGAEASLRAETDIANAQKEKELKIQSYRKEQETVKAEADIAYDMKKFTLQKDVEVEKENIEIAKKEKQIELSEKEIRRKELELDANVRKQAEADKYKEQQQADATLYTTQRRADAEQYRRTAEAAGQAEAIKAEGIARAEAIKAQSEAEAAGIRMKGEAEAKAMSQKAEAFKLYNDAAVTQMVIDRLPEIAQAVAEPLSKTEKIVIVDNGGGQGSGAGKISGYVTDIMSSLPETVDALTGVNLKDVLKNTFMKEEAVEVEKKTADKIEID